MKKVIFGPSGNGDAFYKLGYKSSIEAPKWLRGLGLDAYEYSFGRGFTMSADTAKKLGEEAKKFDISISVHAPFYVNLANPSEDMIDKSFGYIIKSFEYLQLFGGEHVVVHIGSTGKLDRGYAISLIKKNLIDCVNLLQQKGYRGKLCIETMGKTAQIGTYKEVVDLCSLHDMLIPCFDFGHINCLMQGMLKNKQDYLDIFGYAIDKLGFDKIDSCHIHFSKIEYGGKGEIRHLDFDDEIFGPNFEPLAEAIKELNIHPHIICESSTKMSEDALKMQEIYNAISI